jgi:hypothetical protein
MPDLPVPIPYPPEELAHYRDPAAAVVAILEPVTAWLNHAVSIEEVDEVRAQATAVSVYVRQRDLGVAAQRAAETIIRRAEVRIGELLGPAQHGGTGASCPRITCPGGP